MFTLTRINGNNIKQNKTKLFVASNSSFLIILSFKHGGVNLWYFKLWLLNLVEFIVCHIKGLWHQVAKIKNVIWVFGEFM